MELQAFCWLALLEPATVLIVLLIRLSVNKLALEVGIVLYKVSKEEEEEGEGWGEGERGKERERRKEEERERTQWEMSVFDNLTIDGQQQARGDLWQTSCPRGCSQSLLCCWLVFCTYLVNMDSCLYFCWEKLPLKGVFSFHENEMCLIDVHVIKSML